MSVVRLTHYARPAGRLTAFVCPDSLRESVRPWPPDTTKGGIATESCSRYKVASRTLNVFSPWQGYLINDLCSESGDERAPIESEGTQYDHIMSCMLNENGIISNLRFLGMDDDIEDQKEPLSRPDTEFVLITGTPIKTSVSRILCVEWRNRIIKNDSVR